jgi:hypothetical protein
MHADTVHNSGDNVISATDRGLDLVAPTSGKAPEGIELGHSGLDLKKLRVRDLASNVKRFLCYQWPQIAWKVEKH